MYDAQGRGGERYGLMLAGSGNYVRGWFHYNVVSVTDPKNIQGPLLVLIEDVKRLDGAAYHRVDIT